MPSLLAVTPAPANAHRPPEAGVNISDFERFILVQNGGSSGAGRLGSLHQGQPLVRTGGPGMAITAPGVTCYTAVAPGVTHVSPSLLC